MELEEIKKLTEQGEGEYLEKGCRPCFGSPGGKRYLAKTIVSYIPEHKTYLEPFLGGGAVFFAKEPSEVEVINDLDNEIAFAYKFMKKIDDEDLEKLKKKNWTGSKSHFDNLKKSKPGNDLERFYKFSYIMRFSRFKNYVSSFEGQEAGCASALPNIKERLKNVKIENNDYKESINYDSKETFYYLDPPYPDTENKTIGGDISLVELHDFCKKIKGKFILSLNDVKAIKEAFKDFHIKKVKVLQSFSNTEGTQEFRRELLISNFPLKKENIYLSKSDEVLIEDLPSFVWIDSFLSLAGSILYERENNREPNDIDVIVRAQEKDGKFWIVLDPALRLKIDRILEKRFGNKSVEWIASTYGPDWSYLPIYDLALIPRKPQKVIEVNESQFASEFYKEENYEEFCDFGGGHFSKFVKEHPEFNSEEFREYVIVHNKADRDSGELEDIAASEILRLAKEFAQEKNIQIKKRHSREKCMECDKPPVYECLWAEGIGHAWFCKKHFKEWATTGDGKGEIISVKEVRGNIAAKRFRDNRNPNIWAELKREFSKEWMNSPTFAYQVAYDKLPDTPLRGRTDSPKRMWNDKDVDKEFKDKWLEDLNSIQEIEIRATDIGHSTERVAFVVFRFKDKKNDSKAKDIADSLNKLEGLYCKSDIGTEGRPRICVAGKIKLGDKNWESWWNSLAGKIKGVLKEEFEKLHLEEFKRTGLDEDLRSPKERHAQLFADLRYLGNGAYPKIGLKGAWKEWTREDILKYYAKIVDKLRSVWFPVIPPKIGDKEFNTSYWKCYRASREYMKSSPPEKDEVKEWDKKREGIIKEKQEIAKFAFKKIDQKEFIVGGIVYFSNKTDSQQDWTSPPEIWRALKNFMLKKKTIKVMHQGIKRDVPIVENYFVEEGHHKGGMSPENLLEKGDWWMSVYLGDKENKDIWERVLRKELTGFSMGGRASSPA